MKDVLRISLDWTKPELTVETTWGAVVFLAAVTAIMVALRWTALRSLLRRAEVVEFEIGPHIPKFKFGVDKIEGNIYVAHRILVELETRKAAINIEPDKDVIEEVYNSWYELFNIIRDEIKSVPAKYLQREDTRKLLELTRSILNEGLRPHLTTYQAEFRRWYEQAKKAPEHVDLSPQEIQRKYPRYTELIDDMKKVNTLLRAYAGELRKLIN